MKHVEWPRAIAHLDLDQFYAAVEILDFPELKGKPLIVGGKPGSRGVVCTASYEARRFGVKSAMPSTQAARLCPQGIWRPPRMSRYAQKSREVFAVLQQFTGQIEPLSLDEAFLDLTGSQKLFGDPQSIGLRIKAEVLARTGLVASVGIAVNKFLAKVASDLKKPNGFVVVPPDCSAAEFLAPLPVSRLWGAGPKTTQQLNDLGLTTVGQLGAVDVEWLKRRIGANSAEHLLALAQGQDDRAVESNSQPKTIGRENTFAEDLHTIEAMERELLGFADEVAARLRKLRLRCMNVTLKVRFADFSRITRAASFEEPMDVAEPLYQAAVQMLRGKVDFRGQGVRLLGLSAGRLILAADAPAVLFPDEDSKRRRAVAKTVDGLRARFGNDAVVRGRLLEGREDTTGTPTEAIRPEDSAGSI